MIKISKNDFSLTYINIDCVYENKNKIKIEIDLIDLNKINLIDWNKIRYWDN